MTNESHHWNRLAESTSPYLLQHARNPVEWYPWGEEALAAARQRNRPILLSIGYSACHWCHVMAHESFEDPTTAEVMNRLFINIKVDREERPDLDRIYQAAHQLLTRRPGGWPLTMFLTPDEQIPFFGGTYFPDRARHGLPAFRDLLERVAETWRLRGDEIRAQNEAVIEALAEMAPTPALEDTVLDRVPLAMARRQLEQSFDRVHGGFGQAPKFPHPTYLNRLLRQAERESDTRARKMVLLSLERMAHGGLFDQVGGGFFRYSVDDRWMIPHFEKMLCDNALLLPLYADAWRITGDPLYRDTAERIAVWAMEEMQLPEGGYASSLDADSEGEEGRFYLWTPEEVAACLDTDEYVLAARYWGLDGDANFEGRWHLHARERLETVAAAAGVDGARAGSMLDSTRRKLYEARRHRVSPGRDDKVLTAWNALMIRGMAYAGGLLEHPGIIASAERALAFLRATLWRDGRLLATCKDGRAHLPAYLDDYAFLLDALLTLLQVRWRGEDLDLAESLAEVLLVHFSDPAGGFFFTADDHERLIQRMKPFSDEATPSGNGVAALALGRLGHLMAEPRYLRAAEGVLRGGWNRLQETPYAHCTLLDTLEERFYTPEVLTLRGEPERVAGWHRIAMRHHVPWRLVIALPNGMEGRQPAFVDAGEVEGVAAFFCEGPQCSAPVTDERFFLQRIQRGA